MSNPDILSERLNFWALSLIGILAFVLYQVLQVPFALELSSSGEFTPRSAFWIGLGITVSGLIGVMLPLFYLAWSQRIAVRSQFMLSAPRFGTSLAVIASTFSMIPALELITFEVSRIVPPSESYLLFLERMQTAGAGAMVLLVLALAFVVPFAEELLFRGFIQRILLRYVSGPLAVLLVAILFGVVHPPYSIPGVVLLGLYFGALAIVLNNLFYPIIAHAAWNLANLSVLKLTPGDLSLPPESPFSANPFLWFLASALLFVFFSRFWFREGRAKKNPPPGDGGF